MVPPAIGDWRQQAPDGGQKQPPQQLPPQQLPPQQQVQVRSDAGRRVTTKSPNSKSTPVRVHHFARTGDSALEQREPQALAAPAPAPVAYGGANTITLA